MEYVAHETALNATQQDGSTWRSHLERRALGGSVTAIQKLIGPEYPEAIEYLNRWRMQLHGRSGMGQMGFAPLTFTTITDWSELMGERLTADDVDALIRLDTAMLSSGAVEEETEAEVSVSRPAWPTKKVVR